MHCNNLSLVELNFFGTWERCEEHICGLNWANISLIWEGKYFIPHMFTYQPVYNVNLSTYQPVFNIKIIYYIYTFKLTHMFTYQPVYNIKIIYYIYSFKLTQQYSWIQYSFMINQKRIQKDLINIHGESSPIIIDILNILKASY